MYRKSISLLMLVFGLTLIPAILSAQQANEDLEYRKWRITLFPPISTNGLEAPNYTAKYSINLLAGYHGGLDGIEVGGLVNYTKYYTNGFQIAGLANATGGEMSGINFAGLANLSQDDMAGIQVAGISNISGDDLEGIQVSGAFNVANGNVSGVQGAGIGNIARNDIEGLQASGILNAAWGNIEGLQAAGVANIAKENVEGLMASGGVNIARENASGLLFAGGLNLAKNVQGLVITGGANIGKNMTGVQFGALNASQSATGLQIGVVNLAKEFEGMPIGFISLYGNGRKNIDVRFSDGGFTDVGLTLGTYRVYNSALFGYNTLLDRDVYRVGLAVGVEKRIQDSFENWKDESIYVNQEFAATHQFEDSWSRDLNLIYSYKFLVGKRFGNGFSFYAGPTFNAQITRVPEAADYTWYSLWSPEWKGRDYRFWVGFTTGIRLFKQKTPKPFSSGTSDHWEIDW